MNVVMKGAGAAVLALAVSACNYHGESAQHFTLDGCPADTAERVKAANWAGAETVDLRIRDDEFYPMVMVLRTNSPYVLRITNSDDGKRTFRSKDLFGSVAVAEATVSGEVVGRDCFFAINVPAESTTEIKLVTGIDGRYEYQNTRIPWMVPHQMAGVIVVE